MKRPARETRSLYTEGISDQALTDSPAISAQQRPPTQSKQLNRHQQKATNHIGTYSTRKLKKW